ncbi:hypothetical protein MLGJGCBP_03111 [Rhodococcus sp. T7]|nr:hypothetical protein MLGJGCBP_03111 [Rhodococcus sp. T7]
MVAAGGHDQLEVTLLQQVQPGQWQGGIGRDRRENLDDLTEQSIDGGDVEDCALEENSQM